MGAPSKRAKTVRKASEFDLARLINKLFIPRDGRTTIDSWSLEDIYLARTDQMIGQFILPARMAEQFNTDDALFTARTNRLAPRRCIPVEIEPARGGRAAAIADEAEALYGGEGVGITAAALNSIHDCLLNHGIAFATCVATPREDGSRVDLELHYWPIEYVRWDPVFRVFKARADPNTVQPGDIPETGYNEYGFVGGYWIPIIHGDGRWVIFSDYEIESFRRDAVLLPASLVWARHAFAARDWLRASKAHGSVKMIGELPAGVPLQDAKGDTAEAMAMIQLMRDFVEQNAPVGLRPAGSKTEFIASGSTAWQVFDSLMMNAEKAAARIYLGTDGTLGSQGGAPGVDIQSLFGVATTKVRNDLEVLSRGINTGLIQPWCAINFGDSKFAPKRKYCVPNDDERAVHQDFSERNAAFYAALGAARAAGLVLTPEFVASLAKFYKVPPPELGAPIVPEDKGKQPSAAAPPALAIVKSTIRHEGSKWVVYSEDGSKRLGEYDTKEEAEKRLRQIEFYKSK